MKTYYSIHLAYTNKSKNKLQQEFQNFIVREQRKLFSKLKDLQDLITNEAEKLSKAYPRCKALDVTFFCYKEDGTSYTIMSYTGVTCSIEKVFLQRIPQDNKSPGKLFKIHLFNTIEYAQAKNLQNLINEYEEEYGVEINDISKISLISPNAAKQIILKSNEPDLIEEFTLFDMHNGSDFQILGSTNF
jgi:hypothetical protein